MDETDFPFGLHKFGVKESLGFNSQFLAVNVNRGAF